MKYQSMLYIDYIAVERNTSYTLDPDKERREPLGEHYWVHVAENVHVFLWTPDLKELKVTIDYEEGILTYLFMTNLSPCMESFQQLQEYLQVHNHAQVDPWDCLMLRVKYPCFAQVDTDNNTVCCLLIR
jgi:hypothetical protein